MQQRPRRPNRQQRRGNNNNTTHDQTRNALPHSHSPHHPSASPLTSRAPRQPPSYTPVPPYSSIHPGTSVSIVLKQDQPTGHQVQGIVAELLTRGDHPRGVKVRLRDGRVGRVQAVLSSTEEVDGSSSIDHEPRLGVGGSGGDSSRTATSRGTNRGSARSRGRGVFHHVQDVRNDEYMYDENRSRNLGAYFSGLEALDALDAREAANRSELEREREPGIDVQGQLATCPVCHVFEGDERAVAHHVEGHFADA